MDEIKVFLKETIADIAKVKKTEISENILLEDIGLDSLGLIEMIVAIEGKYGFEIEDEMMQFSKLDCIKNISDYIYRRINE